MSIITPTANRIIEISTKPVAKIAVGKRVINPVLINSITGILPNPNPKIMKPNDSKLKKSMGLYALRILIIDSNTNIPSLIVLSFETEPSGLFRKTMSTSSISNW